MSNHDDKAENKKRFDSKKRKHSSRGDQDQLRKPKAKPYKRQTNCKIDEYYDEEEEELWRTGSVAYY